MKVEKLFRNFTTFWSYKAILSTQKNWWLSFQLVHINCSIWVKLCVQTVQAGSQTGAVGMQNLLYEGNWGSRITGLTAKATLQSCTGPVQGQNRVFPVKFSTQGKTCFHYREPLFSLQGPLFSLQGFPCEKTSQGEPCFHYREWVCTLIEKMWPTSYT